MRTLYLLVFGFLFSMSLSAQITDPGVWTLPAYTTAAYTANRTGSIAFIIGSKLYYGMGIDSIGPYGTVHNDLYSIDLTNMGAAPVDCSPSSALGVTVRTNAIAFVINGKAYICCGKQYQQGGSQLADVWEFDPNGNSWTQVASYDGGVGDGQVAGMVGAVVNGKAYVGTGYKFENSIYDYFSDWYRFEPSAGTNGIWYAETNFPGGPRVGCTAFAANGKVYTGLGYNSNCTSQSDIFPFTPSASGNGSWSTTAIAFNGGYFGADFAASFTLYDRYAFIATGDGAVHYVSGFPTKCTPATNVTGVVYSSVAMYDAVLGTWNDPNTTAPVPQALYGAAVAYNDTSAYLIGGQNIYGNLVPTIYKYTNPALQQHLGINESNTADLKVYPNPTTTGTFYFKGLNQGDNIVVSNTLGQNIYTAAADNDYYPVNLSGQDKGIYFYKVNGRDNSIRQGKIVLE